MNIKEFNNLNKKQAGQKLFLCCGSRKWTENMLKHFPFASAKLLIENSASIWYHKCKQDDWLEAFSHHPKIGDTVNMAKKFASTVSLAEGEQSGVRQSSNITLKALAAANKSYQKKFGFIFIICATGKSASEMLNHLDNRLQNNREEEFHVAMGEQHKITTLRIMKMFQETNWSSIKISQLTTHVLDTSMGKPASNLTVRLKTRINNGWQTTAQGQTDTDGRIMDLLPPGKVLNPGVYQLIFETGNYFKEQKIKGFYPVVDIQFSVTDDSHYHVPLLLNPFGYSTYRGT